LIGVSVGALGTVLAQQHLRYVLAYLDVPPMGQPEAFVRAKQLFDAAGLVVAGDRAFLQAWIDRYVACVRRHGS
jgi:chromate reductase, NAD(P)H dehydrogenase (quinone)